MEKLKHVTLAALLVSAMAGCSNIGNAPAGQSPEEAKAAFEAKTPEEKIKIIESSPMAPEEKKRRINELKQQAGMPTDSAPASGAPGANGPPGGTFPGDPRTNGK